MKNTGTSFKEKVVSSEKINATKYRNQATTENIRKALVSLSQYFLAPMTKVYFWKGDLVLSSETKQTLCFSCYLLVS